MMVKSRHRMAYMASPSSLIPDPSLKLIIGSCCLFSCSVLKDPMTLVIALVKCTRNVMLGFKQRILATSEHCGEAHMNAAWAVLAR